MVATLVPVALLLALAAPSAAAAPSVARPGPGSPSGRSPGAPQVRLPLTSGAAAGMRTAQQVVVRTRPVAAAAVRAQAASVSAAALALGARPGIRADRLHAQAFTVPVADLARVVAALRARPDVVSVETPVPSRFFDVPNDTRYAALQKTYLDQVNAPAAWSTTHGGAGITVAVVDSGVDVSHPDLAGKIVGTYDATNDGTDVTDEIGHGTAVAGTAAAVTNNASGIAGSGWDTSILAVKVADANGVLLDPAIAKGIQWAVDNGADVVNLSLGSPSPSTVIADAVAYARAAGVVVVAAAGNSGNAGNPVEYPAAYPGVIAVGATDPWAGTPTRASFSEYGAWVSVAAPGVGIQVTCSSQASLMPSWYIGSQCTSAGGYLAADGTSFAAPIVAGEVALLKAADPAASESALRAAVIDSAHGYAGLGLGTGLVDFGAAVLRLTPTTVPVLADPSTLGSVSGTVALSAASTAAKVRFTLDGAPLGAPVAVVGGTAALDWSTFGWSGPHVLGAVDCSIAGACSATADTVTVSVDNTAPVITSPAPDAALSGPFTVTADAPGGGVRVYVDGASAGFDGTAPYSADVPVSLADGQHSITVRQCDPTGAVCLGAESAAVSITTLSLHPVIASVLPSTFSPNADGRRDTAAATVSLPQASSVAYRVLGAGGVPVTGWHRSGTWTAGPHAITLTGRDDAGARLPDGAYTLQVKTSAIVDAALRYGAATRAFRLDSTAPLLSALTPSGTTFYPVRDGFRDTFAPSVTVSEAASVTLTVTTSTGVRVLSRTASRTSAGRVAIAWTGRTSSGSLLRSGTYRWRLTVQDPAGNRRYTALASVKLSSAKLVSRTSTVRALGSTASPYGGTDPSCAGASTGQSYYPAGIWLYNNCPDTTAEQAIALWEVTLPVAISYTSMALWAYGYTYYAPSTLIGGFYDYRTGDLVQTGGVDIYTTSDVRVPLGSTPATGRVSGRYATVAAAVPNGSPTSGGPWDFDVSYVDVVVTYRVLG